LDNNNVDIVSTILNNLTWYRDRWLTKGGELGDAMSANAGFTSMFPHDPRIQEYVRESFVGGRPFRSPVHAVEYLSGAMTPETLKRSFSRDHCLSLAWYCLWTGKTWPMGAIARYAGCHGFKFGAEGTYSQVGLTPNVLWAFNAVLRHVSKTSKSGLEANAELDATTLPWYYRIWPGWLIAIVQLISALTVPVGYRLNLCAEMALFARLTGRWSWLWKKVAEVCVKKQQENLYYRIVLHGGNEIAATGGIDELELIARNYKPDGEWLWCWYNRTRDGRLKACGADLLLAYRLLTKGDSV
jgi:hypothetical protein